MNLDQSTTRELVRRALDQQKEAYAPYSHFHVGAALLAGSGTVYTGVNVENAAYSASICAERNVVTHAVACGERKFLAIAVAGGLNGENRGYCPPCGVCRQVLREFCDPEALRVILAKSEDDYREMTLEDLLPGSFGPEWLKK